MDSVTEWNNYLSAQSGAAATLTGLVFVSVSINLSRIISIPGLANRAAESLIQFFGVFVISSTLLIPRQPAFALGIEVLFLGSTLWILQTLLQIRYKKIVPVRPRSWLLSRLIQTQLSSVPFCISGVLLMLETPHALHWLVPGFVFSLISGVISAWVLLVEILR